MTWLGPLWQGGSGARDWDWEQQYYSRGIDSAQIKGLELQPPSISTSSLSMLLLYVSLFPFSYLLTLLVVLHLLLLLCNPPPPPLYLSACSPPSSPLQLLSLLLNEVFMWPTCCTPLSVCPTKEPLCALVGLRSWPASFVVHTPASAAACPGLEPRREVRGGPLPVKGWGVRWGCGGSQGGIGAETRFCQT